MNISKLLQCFHDSVYIELQKETPNIDRLRSMSADIHLALQNNTAYYYIVYEYIDGRPEELEEVPFSEALETANCSFYALPKGCIVRPTVWQCDTVVNDIATLKSKGVQL